MSVERQPVISRTVAGWLLAAGLAGAGLLMGQDAGSAGRPGGGRPGMPGQPAQAEMAIPLTPIELPPENVADDGWFVVMSGEQQIGHVHHSIRFITERGQKVYKYSEEFQVQPQPSLAFKGERIEATLDETFALRDMIFTRTTMANEDLNLTIETKGPKVIISAPGKGDAEAPAPKNWAVFLQPMLGQWLVDKKLLDVGKSATVRIFVTSGQPGSYWKEFKVEILDEGKITLKLNRPDKSETPEKGAAPKTTAKEIPVFNCRMTPGEGGDPVEFSVARDGKLMKYTAGPMTEWRAEDEFTARGSSEWVIETKGRRDPFTSVTTPVGGVKGAVGETSIEEMSDTESKRRLEEAKERLERMKILAETPDDQKTPAIKSELEKLFGLNLSSFEAMARGKAREEYRKKMEEFVEESKKFYKPIDALLKQLRVYVDQAQKAFEGGVAADDVRYFQSIPQILTKAKDLAKQPEVTTAPDGASQVEPLVKQIEGLRRRADIRIEFSSKDIAKKQSGIIYVLQDKEIPVSVGIQFLGRPMMLSTRVRVSSSASMAILNGPKEAITVMEGDEVGEIIDGLVVKRIERDGIVYRYRDEEIKVTFR